jgi:hypothetical protein
LKGQVNKEALENEKPTMIRTIFGIIGFLCTFAIVYKVFSILGYLFYTTSINAEPSVRTTDFAAIINFILTIYIASKTSSYIAKPNQRKKGAFFSVLLLAFISCLLLIVAWLVLVAVNTQLI